MAKRSAMVSMQWISSTSRRRRSTAVHPPRRRLRRSSGMRTSSSTVTTISNVRLGCARSAGKARQRGEDPEHGAVLRRLAPGHRGIGVRCRLDDEPILRDGMHQGDPMPFEQPRELPLERPEHAGLDLDDPVADEDIGHEAVDGLLGDAAWNGVVRLQGAVQGPLVELADACGDGQGPVALAAQWMRSNRSVMANSSRRAHHTGSRRADRRNAHADCCGCHGGQASRRSRVCASAIFPVVPSGSDQTAWSG